MKEPLESQASRMIPAVEMEMQEVLRLRSQQGDPFYGMMHYHMGWVEKDFQPAKTKAGKRVRPLLCLLSTEAAGADWEHKLDNSTIFWRLPL